MSVFKRRSLMVSFRVSEDEYKQLKAVALAHGARSLSDFARMAVRYWAENSPGTSLPSPYEGRMLEMQGKINQLNTEIERIRRLLEL